ncbi:SAP domain protein [Aspergillus sp. HF37]|nr:SAP domain protein [Aspergillus sp. HF37]
MTDYSSWKVNDLKSELKRRGIPQTGLRVKQNFADRLVEDDAKQQSGGKLEEQSQEPDTAKGDEQTERDQHAQQAQPSESQERKPDEKTPQEQKQEEEAGTQHGARAEEQDEHKVEEQLWKETGDALPQQEQQVEISKEPEPEAASEALSEAKTEKETPAEPAEQAPGDTITQEPAQAAPEGDDATAPSDKLAPAAPSTSEVNTEVSTPVPTEEALEDSRKRKRRSRSPVPTPDAIANKKVRARSESPRILLPEDRGAEGAPPEKDVSDTAAAREPQEAPEEETHRASITEDSRTRKGAPLKQGARFKELFAPAGQEPVRPASPPRDVAMKDAEVEHALHDATAALYVDGLMRPLQPAALKNHLISLASAPGASPHSDVVVDFYLDPIKTHCFASFANVSAASQARSSLHGTVWPNERNRKPLFVDFIPEHKMQQWINTEEGSRGRGGPAPRWGVKYDRTNDGVEAVLEEVDAKTAPSQGPSREPTAPRAPPLGPRASLPHNDRRPGGPPAADPRPRPGQGFKPLDDLFMSTTAKPKLYFQPVSREVADQRLDRFDDLIRKGSYPRRGGNEARRISFERVDSFVDQGPEFGNRNRRGGRGRGRGFGRGEGPRDRY